MFTEHYVTFCFHCRHLSHSTDLQVLECTVQSATSRWNGVSSKITQKLLKFPQSARCFQALRCCAPRCTHSGGSFQIRLYSFTYTIKSTRTVSLREQKYRSCGRLLSGYLWLDPNLVQDDEATSSRFYKMVACFFLVPFVISKRVISSHLF